MTVEKPKQLLRPITTGANSAINQSQLLAITCNSLKAREKSRVHGAIGFGQEPMSRSMQLHYIPVTAFS